MEKKFEDLLAKKWISQRFILKQMYYFENNSASFELKVLKYNISLGEKTVSLPHANNLFTSMSRFYRCMQIR